MLSRTSENTHNAYLSRAGFARFWCAFLFLTIALTSGPARAQVPAEQPPASEESSTLPKVFTNETYIKELSRKSTLRIDNPKAVFLHILKSLPPRVKVFPTENYYYFYFYHNGAKYVGNLRLDVDMRKKGLVFFNYFRETRDWFFDESDRKSTFGQSDGVVLDRVSPLVYRLTADGTSVVFELNDVSAARPPSGLLDKDETYIGPVFDESGIPFFLVFNRELKIFHFLLDETKPVLEEFIPTQVSKNIIIGRRTGFAFYLDGTPKRKVLVGVYGPNTEVNNYYDGPFDQLPDNFLLADKLRKAILQVNPELEGKIDRLGNTASGNNRYLIAPYLHYGQEKDLEAIETCLANRIVKVRRSCFAMDESVTTGGLQ